MRKPYSSDTSYSGSPASKDAAFVDEWVDLMVALMKLGVGETEIQPAHLVRLIQLNMVEFEKGVPVLTARGRTAAGISDD
jgi:hypothetical protein